MQVKFWLLCLFVFCIDFIIDSFIAGKRMENLRSRPTVNLVASEERPKKLPAQLSLKQFKIFHESLVPVKQAKVELTLKGPIYMGFVILDLSKVLTYDFHYSYIKHNSTTPPDLMLLFTNTDSFTYQIQTDFHLD